VVQGGDKIILGLLLSIAHALHAQCYLAAFFRRLLAIGFRTTLRVRGASPPLRSVRRLLPLRVLHAREIFLCMVHAIMTISAKQTCAVGNIYSGSGPYLPLILIFGVWTHHSAVVATIQACGVVIHERCGAGLVVIDPERYSPTHFQEVIPGRIRVC
jgi:hypothetical protein